MYRRVLNQRLFSSRRIVVLGSRKHVVDGRSLTTCEEDREPTRVASLSLSHTLFFSHSLFLSLLHSFSSSSLSHQRTQALFFFFFNFFCPPFLFLTLTFSLTHSLSLSLSVSLSYIVFTSLVHGKAAFLAVFRTLSSMHTHPQMRYVWSGLMIFASGEMVSFNVNMISLCAVYAVHVRYFILSQMIRIFFFR